MYDDGSGYLENIHIKKALSIEWQELYEEPGDTDDLYVKEASDILGCTEEELRAFLDASVQSGYIFNEVLKKLEDKLMNDGRYTDKIWDRYKEVDY